MTPEEMRIFAALGIDATVLAAPRINMTRRDWFAAMAVQGLAPCWNQRSSGIHEIAGYAVEMADALIAALDKKP